MATLHSSGCLPSAGRDLRLTGDGCEPYVRGALEVLSFEHKPARVHLCHRHFDHVYAQVRRTEMKKKKNE